LNNPETSGSLKVSKKEGMKRYFCVSAFFLLALATPGMAQTSLLPERLAGWQASGPAVTVKASELGPKWERWAEGEQILAESGVVKIQDRPYRKGADQRGLRVYQFKDPSSAFEFYTFAVVPGMQPLGLGEDSAIQQDDARILVGNLVVQAGLSARLAPSMLHDVAEALRASTDQTPLPSLRTFLPTEGRVFGSVKYAFGPLGFQSAARALERPEIGELASKVGFERDSAEAVFARYRTPKEDAVLLLIEYPTQHLAEQHLRHLETVLSPAAKQAGTTLGRKGPLLSLVIRPSSSAYGEALRSAVNYETQVTWNEPRQTMTDPPWATILGKIFVFTLIFMIVAVAFGVAFGGVRVLAKIFFPGKVFDRPNQMDVLQLGLSGKRIDSKDFY
jgi:hypothetical protein